MKGLPASVWLMIVFCIFPPGGWCRVIVDDMVALQGRKVMLRAETRGKFFADGGRLVAFFIDGKSIGKTLSGGDGVAYKPFAPPKTGLHQIEAVSGDDRDSGQLLVLSKGAGIVFIDIEGALLEGRFSRKPKPGSQRAVEEISKSYAVVFLQRGLIGVGTMKEWLKDHHFSALPLVPWQKGAIFDNIVEAGFRVKAVIGSAEVIESARKHSPLALSFEPVDGAEWAGDWEEIRAKLVNPNRGDLMRREDSLHFGLQCFEWIHSRAAENGRRPSFVRCTRRMAAWPIGAYF